MLVAADGGVDHWHTHVQARTDMMAGKISPDRMKALWKRTRLAGPADQDRFAGATEKLVATPACRTPEGADATSASQACVERAESASNAIDAAAKPMAEWQKHLDAMATFADGGMTVHQSQAGWVKAWRKAPAGIQEYRTARQNMTELASCE